MEVNVREILSPQQRKVYTAICRGESYSQIASDLGVNKKTIATHWKRIKEKIKDMDGCDDIIMDIFNEESERTLPRNKTVKQMQFLTQTGNMHQTISPAMENYYRKKTMPKRTKTKVRKMTEEDYKAIKVPERQEIPKDIKRLEMHYRAALKNPDYPVDKLGLMEVVLRSYGLLYLTPAISKLNSRTTKMMRAKEEGFRTTIIKPGEGVLLLPGSKFIESVRDEEGKPEYSVWLVPRVTRVQQEKKA